MTSVEIKEIAEQISKNIIAHFEQKAQALVPQSFIKEALSNRQIERLKQKYLRKKALSYKEIADAQLWGEITVRAVKSYAKKYAKPLEILEVVQGKRKKQKLVMAAVQRIAKQRGIT